MMYTVVPTAAVWACVYPVHEPVGANRDLFTMRLDWNALDLEIRQSARVTVIRNFNSIGYPEYIYSILV